MRARGAKAQTFFRWSGQTEWTPERMGQKYTPRMIIWDEVCTMPRPILETFLDWLNSRGVQVVCCGDQGQPPPIAERCRTTGCCGELITMKRSWPTTGLKNRP
ncbi:MAG: hypothetical protein AB2556_25480 [Candidatus Thiodiazotropha sp.]